MVFVTHRSQTCTANNKTEPTKYPSVNHQEAIIDLDFIKFNSQIELLIPIYRILHTMRKTATSLIHNLVHCPIENDFECFKFKPSDLLEVY